MREDKQFIRRCRMTHGKILACLLVIGACSGPRGSADETPDMQFGHRVEGEDPDGRRTLTISAPGTQEAFTVLPATFESVTVRPAPLVDDEDEVAVEILIKGAFPDACIELHQFEQVRSGNLIEATLNMRRPDGAVCMNVRRPYRLYLMLEGAYKEGNYVLKVNGEAIPFTVRVDPQA